MTRRTQWSRGGPGRALLAWLQNSVFRSDVHSRSRCARCGCFSRRPPMFELFSWPPVVSHLRFCRLLPTFFLLQRSLPPRRICECISCCERARVLARFRRLRPVHAEHAGAVIRAVARPCDESSVCVCLRCMCVCLSVAILARAPFVFKTITLEPASGRARNQRRSEPIGTRRISLSQRGAKAPPVSCAQHGAANEMGGPGRHSMSSASTAVANQAAGAVRVKERRPS